MWERVCNVLESCEAACGIENNEANDVDNGEKPEVRMKGVEFQFSRSSYSAVSTNDHTMKMNPLHNPPPPRTAHNPPPPSSSRLPPPRYQPTNTTAAAASAASQQQHAAAANEVDSAIARRRAELRRLQERRGRDPPAYASGWNGGGATPHHTSGGGVSSISSNGSMTPLAPSTRDTPSTAAIARRLDNSYGPPVMMTQQQQSQQPNLSHYKRTSEIFSRSSSSGTGATPVAARTRSSSSSQPAPPSNKEESSNSSPKITTPRSPFGAARATLKPAMPVGDTTAILVPPLLLEPVVMNTDKSEDNDDDATKQTIHSTQGILKHNTVVTKEKSVNSNNTSSDFNNEKDTTLASQVMEDTVKSGASTPIHSNSLSTEKTLEKANRALMEASRQKPQNQNVTKSTDVVTKQPSNEKVKSSHARSKSTSSLIEQLNRAVAIKGEKAVLGLLEKLEKPNIHNNSSSSSHFNSYNSTPSTPRGRSMDLLSSMGAPLTPRSRPSSPERWNGSTAIGAPAVSSLDNNKKRATTPLPKGDKLESHYILNATEILPNEYETELVNYIVRGPTNSTTTRDKFVYDFFSSEESYRENFDIDNSDSIEVLAMIEADGSVLALTGKDARHGKSGSSDQDGEKVEWSVYENLEDSQCDLGTVTYIDVEGNEREYWLEHIYDEAMSIRESYCTSIRSAACALKYAADNGENRAFVSSQDIPQNNPSVPPMSQPPAMPMYHNDNSLNRSAMQGPDLGHPSIPNQFTHQDPNLTPSSSGVPEPKHNQIPPEHNIRQQQPVKQGNQSVKQTAEKTQKSPPASTEKKSSKEQPEEFEAADSALPLMIMSLFSIFFSIVWFVFFKLPYRLCSTVLTLCFVLMFLRLLWYLLADDNGAWEMGAGVDFEYNSPGIY